MSIVRINQLPSGSDSLTSDDVFPFMDDPSGSGITKQISLSQIATAIGTSSSSEAASLITNVFNKTGSPIPKMAAVYISGGQGDQPTISLAQASGESTSSKTYGLTAENISNMSSGKVIVFGSLTGLNTDQFNPTAPMGNVNGVTLYLSPTTPGGLTTTKPFAPNHMVAIGTIIRTHQNEGIIEVRVQNGFELEELHNVAISGVSNGQFLQYNSGSGLWLASSSGNFSSLTVNNIGVSLVGHAHTSSNITDFNSSVSGLLPVKNISAGSGIEISSSSGDFIVSVTGIGLTSEEVDDRVSNLLVAGNYVNLNYNDNSNNLTIDVTGLQPSGNYSVVGHTHTSSNITNFNSSVSALLPTISNSGDNRLLTSTGSSTGINAENNITFDGNKLNVIGSISVGNLNFATNIISSSPPGNIIINPMGGTLQRDSGGDTRGVYAVDWQGDRNLNTQVASGPYSTIGGGRSNTSSGYSVVGGGYNNTSSGSHSTTGGGYINTSSGSYSTVGGGYRNMSSGSYSTVGGGYRNTSSELGTTVGGGKYNTASGGYSTVDGGYGALADRYGMQAYAAGNFSNSGDSQRVDFVLRNITTNDTSTTLFLNGSDTHLTIPSNKALFATINIAGIIDGGSKAAHYVRKVAIKNVEGATTLIGTVSTLGTDIEDDASYDVSITADNTFSALQINVTGKTGETIRWVAHVEGVEISYG